MRELFLLCPPPPPPQSPPPPPEEEEEEMRARSSVAALVEFWGERGRIDDDDDEHLSRHSILSVYLRREKEKKITNLFPLRTSQGERGRLRWTIRGKTVALGARFTTMALKSRE